MEGICGTRAFTVDAGDLAARIRGYHGILMDIGTGDGRYVRHVARACPAWFAIGIDACRENLRVASRKAPDNALFVIANALALPSELQARATRIVVNFPWGSLLEGLLSADSPLIDGLIALAGPQATLEIRLNAGALNAAGWPAEAGIVRVQQVLHQRGFAVGPPRSLDRDALRAYPSTWAKRLAYGRAAGVEPRRRMPRAIAMPAERRRRAPCSAGGNDAVVGRIRTFLMTVRQTLSTAFGSARGYPRLSTAPCLTVTAHK